MIPAGLWPRSYIASASSTARSSSIGWSGEPTLQGPAAPARVALAAARGLPSSTPQALKVGEPTHRLPVVDMIETSERTRSGRRIAIVWPIIPPIEAPTTLADVHAEVVHQPEGVVGHVAQQVGARSRGGREHVEREGIPASLRIVEWPMSRLSKRTTRKPRSASIAQNSSSQASICTASPMIRISGSPSGSPISW